MNNKPPFYLDQKVLFRYLSALLVLAGLVMGWSTNAAAYTDDEDPPSRKPSILNSGILTVGDDTSDNYLNIGGALRYNLYLEDYGGTIGEGDSQFTFDMWRINVEG